MRENSSAAELLNQIVGGSNEFTDIAWGRVSDTTFAPRDTKMAENATVEKKKNTKSKKKTKI